MIAKSRKSELKKTLFKAVIVFLCGLMFVNMLTGFTYAETSGEEYYDDSVYDENGNLRIGKCIEKGGWEFTAFLQATVWSDSFVESIIEPWRDVLKRNTCHAYDILGLVQQRDKLRKRIRDAFLTCRHDQIADLKIAYYKTVVEIFFARNVIYAGWITPQLADMDTLEAQLKSKYVDDYHWFTPEVFETFVNELQLRYVDRRRAYVNECEMTSWADAWQKMKDFYEYVLKGGFVDDIKKEGAKLKRRADKIEQAFGDAGSWEEWAKGLVQVNINNQSPGDFWDEFKSEFNENNPFTKTNFPSTTEGVFETRRWSDLILRQQTLKNEMSSRFQMLYGTAADSNLILFLDTVDSLDQTIIDSFVPLNQIKDCTKNIHKKQCK